jgi:gamma-glutamyl-gamma-aminobutyrate hydrolase PuuD
MKLAVSQRIVFAENYDEKRDALSHDLSRFLSHALGVGTWIAVPNIGIDAVEWVIKNQIEGLILSGGETPGVSKLRDDTERALIRYVREIKKPIFGICRGMQMLVENDGGSLKECDNQTHVNSTHRLSHLSTELTLPSQVNSFHRVSVVTPLPTNWRAAACSSNDCEVEAMVSLNKREIAIMWHPERQKPYNNLDLELIRSHFLK